MLLGEVVRVLQGVLEAKPGPRRRAGFLTRQFFGVGGWAGRFSE